MSEELDSDYPKRTKRISNRLGMREVDEQDGWVFLSHGAYTCRGTASETVEEAERIDGLRKQVAEFDRESK